MMIGVLWSSKLEIFNMTKEMHSCPPPCQGITHTPSSTLEIKDKKSFLIVINQTSNLLQLVSKRTSGVIISVCLTAAWDLRYQNLYYARISNLFLVSWHCWMEVLYVDRFVSVWLAENSAPKTWKPVWVLLLCAVYASVFVHFHPR